MTGRAFAFASALLIGALGASFVVSCTETAPAPLAGPPLGTAVSLSIVNPVDGATIALPDSPDASFPVTVDVMGTFWIRPPGNACLYTYNCGFLQLFVDGVLNNVSGSAIVDAQIGRTAVPFGKHVIAVRLVWDINDGGGQETYDAGLGNPEAGLPPDVPGGAQVRSVTVTVVRADTNDAGGTGDAGPGDAGGAGDASTDDGGGTTSAATTSAATTSASSTSASSTSTGGGTGGAASTSSASTGGGTGGAASTSSASTSSASTGGGTGGAGPGDGGAGVGDGG